MEEPQKVKKHTFKILSKKYIKQNRSNAYTYLQFDFDGIENTTKTKVIHE